MWWLRGPTLSRSYTHKLWRQPAPESRQPRKHSEARNFPGRGRHRPHAIPGSTCYRWCRSTRAFDGHVGVRNHRAGRASHGELECAGHARGLSHASVAAAAYHSNSSDASAGFVESDTYTQVLSAKLIQQRYLLVRSGNKRSTVRKGA